LKSPKTKTPPPFPSKAEVLRFINESEGRVGRREIARAFGIRGAARAELRSLLRELADEGLVEQARPRRYNRPGELPKVAVLSVYDVDDDGRLHARPVSGPTAGATTPPIIVKEKARAGTPLGVGARLLARLQKTADGYEAEVIRRLEAAPKRLLGVYAEVGGEARVLPTDKRQKYDFAVREGADNGAQRGELVSAEVLDGRRLGLREVRVIERLGQVGSARASSLIAIQTHGVPDRFPDTVLQEAKAAQPVEGLGKRRDLRELPFVTIDGADARDFDDAIWAKQDDKADNREGWQIMVAIADVAHYVTPGSALDREARKRGNSVYFPDRVVPMLPEELSNDLCSLKPDQARPAMAVQMRIDRDGKILEHQFMRALIRSAQRVVYEDFQNARDARPSNFPATLEEAVLRPLFGAWEALERGRLKREPLELELAEMQVNLNQAGQVDEIRRRPRLDAHRVVEEFMIAANVCAAETLEAKRQPCMYRVHAEPTREKMRGLRDFLAPLGLKISLGEVLRPYLFNRVLSKARDSDHWEAVNQAILRCQAQAAYSPTNVGHFGLALPRYAHFTSPIRRYADLLVHRALISGLGLGQDGLAAADSESFYDTAEHISDTERRAMAAERDANDRYIAAYMQDHLGAEFAASISGIHRAGIFVRLEETGADGLIPIASLGRDYFVLDEQRMTLTGERSGVRFRLGDRIDVRLREATPLTGGLIFEWLGNGDAVAPAGRKSGRPRKRGKRRRS
jgi:ribonuclease R